MVLAFAEPSYFTRPLNLHLEVLAAAQLLISFGGCMLSFGDIIETYWNNAPFKPSSFNHSTSGVFPARSSQAKEKPTVNSTCLANLQLFSHTSFSHSSLEPSETSMTPLWPLFIANFTIRSSNMVCWKITHWSFIIDYPINIPLRLRCFIAMCDGHKVNNEVSWRKTLLHPIEEPQDRLVPGENRAEALATLEQLRK